MKFKLDENLGLSIKKLFLDSGYDVQSVFDENMLGAKDDIIFKVCQDEKRCLVTFDLDFSNVLNFPPQQSSGIIVLRPSKEINYSIIKLLIQNSLNFLKDNNVTGNLWIVEELRIRIHKFEND